MQIHEEGSCKIMQIIHKNITIATGSKNHEKSSMIHGGTPFNYTLEHTL